VEIDPIKPMLKGPGAKLSKLKSDERLSNFAFKFNLRCYNKLAKMFHGPLHINATYDDARERWLYDTVGRYKAQGFLGRGLPVGAYTRPPFGST